MQTLTTISLNCVSIIDYVQAYYRPISGELFYTERCKKLWRKNTIFYMSSSLPISNKYILLLKAKLKGFQLSRKLQRFMYRPQRLGKEVAFSSSHVFELMDFVIRLNEPLTESY